MGTPKFAVEPLDRLVSNGYNIVGVITMPDKPVGRHQNELSTSPVKKYAVGHGIKVLQPEKLKDHDFIENLRALRADLQIVVAFRMLPEIVWSMPPLGTFNLHAALLPQYRGAAPINWAIINGDTETGVTTFFLDRDIDTGSIIKRVSTPILDTDNAGDVHDRLMNIGAALVVETVDNIAAGTIKPVPQAEQATNKPLRPAPKIFKETRRIDWTLGVKRVYDFVRGLSPCPAAWSELCHNGKVLMIKIYRTKKEYTGSTEETGSILTDGKTFFKVALPGGYIHLLTVQLAGKKRMDITEFLRGFHTTGNLSMLVQKDDKSICGSEDNRGGRHNE